MIFFRRTELPEVLIVEPVAASDERGTFSRVYGRQEFAEQGIEFVPVQAAVSRSRRSGTLRGLHFQAAPRADAKLVRCTRGAVFDVAVDLRTESPTYARWVAVELTADDRSIFIPEGFGHGFQTLTDDTELHYLISEVYVADAQRGVRWDDPRLAIPWPDARDRVISARDRGLPYLEDAETR